MTRPTLELKPPTFEQLQEIRRLDNQGYGIDDIAAATRLHRDQVKAAKKDGLPLIAVPRERGPNISVHERPTPVSTAQTIERDAREAARCQRDLAGRLAGDVTAAAMGDPPPGYSALDQRRG